MQRYYGSSHKSKAAVTSGKIGGVTVEMMLDSGSSPVILGVDFLRAYALVLDFTSLPVAVHHADADRSSQLGVNPAMEQLCPVYEAACKARTKVCANAAIESSSTDVVDECAMPLFQGLTSDELPECPRPSHMSIVHEYRDLYRTTPRKTETVQHFIPTNGNPVTVPPQCIPAQY